MSAYTSLEALLHDAFWAEEESPELAWLDAVIEEPALEIGCGSGRLLLPLLRKGRRIEGLDHSAEMLELCRRSAGELGLDPALHLDDMATFRPGKTYASVLVPAFTLQLAEDPVAALQNFRRLLRPGGLLYLTVFVPLAELNGELPENEWYADHETTLGDGRRATLDTRHSLDRRRRILRREHRYRLHDGDRVREQLTTQTVRWFTPRELHRLLADAGFGIESAVAEFDEEEPVTDEAQIITVLARAAPPAR